MTNKNLVIIAYLLFFLMVLISYNLYITNQYNEKGKKLNFKTIIKSIFNRFDDINIIDVKVLSNTQNEQQQYNKEKWRSARSHDDACSGESCTR